MTRMPIACFPMPLVCAHEGTCPIIGILVKSHISLLLQLSSTVGKAVTVSCIRSWQSKLKNETTAKNMI